MAAKVGRSYSVRGYVANMVGPYSLAGHGEKKFLVFGFVAAARPPKNFHNCVFYLDFAHRRAAEMAGIVARSLIKPKQPITVFFNGPPDWNEETDPSYIISDVKMGKH